MFRTLDRECNTTRAYQRSFALQLLKTAKKKKKVVVAARLPQRGFPAAVTAFLCVCVCDFNVCE